jgi:signal peptidase I
MVNMLKRLGAFFLDILEVVVFAIAIFLFIYLLVLQPHKIKGDSMQPNFPDGEFLLTDKITYRFGEPKRGDVVVFQAPVAEGEEYIKRIIGLPGDRVSVKEGKVYINGAQLQENYLKSTLFTPIGAFLAEGEEYVVPTGSYFVMGDNRPASSDSRSWGPVAKQKITGRAWVIYWPPEKSGVIKGVTYN